MNISALFHTITCAERANSISGAGAPVSVSNAAVAVHERCARMRRLSARCLVATAATTCLLAAGATPAKADIFDPSGAQIRTVVHCDPGTTRVALESLVVAYGPLPKAVPGVLELRMHDAAGTFLGAVQLGHTFINGNAWYGPHIHGAPGSYIITYNYIWPGGNTFVQGEQAMEYRDWNSGVATNYCQL